MIIGAPHTVSATPTVLTSGSNSTTPCRALSLRLDSGAAGRVYFGDSNLTGASDAFGFIEPGESFGYSSFLPASGMRPNEVYIVGEAGDTLYWVGWVS